MKKGLQIRISAVEDYLKGNTLTHTANKFKIHPVTLCRWVKWYKNAQTGVFIKPWNRPEKQLEEKVMLLKENNPGLTLINAQRILKKQGINLSLNGIHCIWRRYNLTKRPIQDPFSHFAPLTAEVRDAIEYARALLRQNDDVNSLKKIAQILNNLPSYPFNNEDLIAKVPEKYLSLRRKFDQIYNFFLKIPMPVFYRKIKRIRKKMQAQGLKYSAIIAGISEIIALQWMGAPKEELKLNNILRKMKEALRDPIINFQLHFLAAMAHSELLNLKQAWGFTKQAKKMLEKNPLPIFYESFGDLLTYLGDYRQALNFHLKALEGARNNDEMARRAILIGIDFALTGEYSRAQKFISKLQPAFIEIYKDSYSLCRALISFGFGRLEEALDFTWMAFEKIKKEHFRKLIFTVASLLATIARALGKKDESVNILKTYLNVAKKYNLKRGILIMNFLLGNDLIKGRYKSLPTINIFNLLKRVKRTFSKTEYKNLLSYTQRYGLSGYLHRCIIFYPEIIFRFLEKGKDFEVPVSILRLPVFNETTPVYHIQFLGKIRILKNQKLMKIKLTPLEQAFLLFIAFHLGEPGKSADVMIILENFWTRSMNPRNRLAHLLVRLKKNLMMPAYLIKIYSMYDKKLVNKGFYVTTDYSDFQSYIAQAKALERAGEWGFARKEYLRAFKLFRGEPFKKNFDNWSVDMRFKILSQFETEAINFAKSCLEHGNKNDARKILQKVLKIIPDSEEAKRLSDSLVV
ncbi:MAG: helix-turn-helix domain-containing protein [candidate division WOR-3 bacterium]